MISFDEYAEFLARASGIMQEELIAATAMITGRAVVRAQGYIGHQQASWAPLADSTIEGWDAPWGQHFPGKRELGFSPPDYEPLKRSGAMEASIEGAADGTTGVVGSQDEVALWQEMGTHRRGAEHVPPRPFLALSVQEAMPDIEAECGAIAVRALVPEV